MATTKKTIAIRARRRNRVRVRIRGTAAIPRLTVFRSNVAIYAQLIDDATGTTVVRASSRDLVKRGPKMADATAVGKLIAERATPAGITAAVFDRGSYRYHGRVQALAEGARAGGLKF
ncbi:MAG: 50S ribosomal protein L18 [bacterium]|nr:50S ribosomal protein L18 [bacterium]